MEPITFFNRYTNSIENEQVYGESFLNWIYANPLGKISLHALVKRPIFSKWYGWRMNAPKSKQKIKPFIDAFAVDTNEFLENPGDYDHFNAFFYRKLHASARPIASTELVFPADGRHMGFKNAEDVAGVFIKGQQWQLDSLINDAALYEEFQNGSLVLSRLCPVDYHRFHFPCSGIANSTRIINGPLFSVSPIALRKNLEYIWQNKRNITVIETANIGKVLMIEIGATCVGSIHQTYQSNTAINKGEEKGYFAFGGSSTITVFQADKVTLSEDLLEHSSYSRELYARMGDSMGVART